MGFSITDMLNKDTSMAAAPVKDHTIERISYSKLVPSEDNFYSMQEIEELKTAIELALLRRTDRGHRPRRARTGVAHRRQLPARENRMGQT